MTSSRSLSNSIISGSWCLHCTSLLERSISISTLSSSVLRWIGILIQLIKYLPVFNFRWQMKSEALSSVSANEQYIACICFVLLWARVQSFGNHNILFWRHSLFSWNLSFLSFFRYHDSSKCFFSLNQICLAF